MSDPMIPQDEKNLLVSQTVGKLSEEVEFLFHLHNIPLPPLLLDQFVRSSQDKIRWAISDAFCMGIRHLGEIQNSKGEIKDE